MFLKTYNGDARDLTLTFTLLNTELGETNEIELIPNGSQIDVTDENKNRFIGLVAKYHIYDKMKEESEAFCRGLWEVIDKAWLRIFNEPELQVLISGAYDGVIDIDDLKSNTVYVGTLSDLDPVIHRFWKVVRNMTQTQLCFLLKFVTSCERPPSLGFASLEPRFTIQRVDGDDSMLPTSSTCFNILKLPTYSSTKILREKLLLALGEGGGFHLA
jgi:ubiquitin-protein ligase E3 C